FGTGIDDALLRPPLPRARHEDRARAVARADEPVLGVRRTVHEVPAFQVSLLALDQEQALAGKHEEVLLVRLAVVPASRLSRLQHSDREAEVRKGHFVTLEYARSAERLVRHPRGFRNVDDKP